MHYWSKELWVVDICISWPRRLHNTWIVGSPLKVTPKWTKNETVTSRGDTCPSALYLATPLPLSTFCALCFQVLSSDHVTCQSVRPEDTSCGFVISSLRPVFSLVLFKRHFFDCTPYNHCFDVTLSLHSNFYTCFVRSLSPVTTSDNKRVVICTCIFRSHKLTKRPLCFCKSTSNWVL